MLKRFSALLALGACVASATELKPELDCRESLQGVFGRPVPVQQVNGFESKRAKIRIQDLFNDVSDDTVFLGINDQGHAYLNIGGHRYDGELMRMKGGFRTNSNLVEEGLLLKFDVPPENAQLLRNHIATHKERPSWSCLAGACNMLQDAGIEVTEKRLFATQVYRDLLTKHFRTADGTELPVTVYQLGFLADPDNIARTISTRQSRTIDRHTDTAKKFGFFVVVGGGIVWIGYKRFAALSAEPSAISPYEEPLPSAENL